MKFDLTQPAPGPAQLATARREAASMLTRIRRRERLYWLSALMLGALGIGTLYFAWSGGLVGAGAIVTMVMVAAAGAVAVMVAAAGAGAVAGAVMGVGVGVVAGVVVVYDLWIDTPRNRANATLGSLVELEASTLPEQCIQFMDWVEADEMVRAYQHQLAALGRKPVVAEFEAAKTWVEGSALRTVENERIEKARQACAKMAAAV